VRAQNSVVKCENDYLNWLVDGFVIYSGNSKCHQASCIRGNDGLRIQRASASRYIIIQARGLVLPPSSIHSWSENFEPEFVDIVL
jgi:hypothetical protein